MTYDSANPLIVQSDMTMLLEVNSPLYEQVRDAIAPFSEIIKSPEHMHTYQITPISLWNAASAGFSCEEVVRRLEMNSRYVIPSSLVAQIRELMSRYGQLYLEQHDDEFLQITAQTPLLMERFFHVEEIQRYLVRRINPLTALIKVIHRGLIKQVFIKEGYPLMDMAGYAKGADLDVAMKTHIQVRDYQAAARESFLKGGSHLGGCGVIVLPCGAGKTVIGLDVMAQMKTQTLILVTSMTAARQWKGELLDKTSLTEETIGEFSGEQKVIRPVTIATYQILTHRNAKTDEFVHFKEVNNHPWGLIIYDEVHLLPAQVFRFTASLQAVRRLGLTATLIREDGREKDVFSLIGPKRYDLAWKEVERNGWIAQALCFEVHVGIDPAVAMEYATSPKRLRFRIASENPRKYEVVRKLLSRHENESLLIIGQYIDQLEVLAQRLNLPLITGKTPQLEREQLFAQFRNGNIRAIIVSSIGNFSIDLPDASVAVQVSGRFGSRQEEAQRLGRVLRPKSKNNQAHFYTLVTEGTEEQDFALNRQLFLTEQGYDYTVIDEKDIVVENRIPS